MSHEVFVNYRTGNGEKIAALIHENLANRFGDEHIFRASTSIEPGTHYPDALLRAVRRCEVLLAVMGGDWSTRTELHDENDWVRREILEAFDCGIEVIPILDGRRTERLKATDLPQELARLADVQSIRLDLHQKETGLAYIGNELARKIPSLRAADRTAVPPPPPEGNGGVHNSVNEAHGTVVQSGQISGDVGNVFKGTHHGALHTGKGDMNFNSPNISGPGATFIAGDNRGGIRQNFGSVPPPENDRKNEDGS
ncbi:toll/interleukin-1 receptor domain-containing protein [Spongiactinospora rosea]|uniref:Toll/interleukin-1 receptor domain-containing protein n=1 Tax=Spongiactinospora rosea TaxID=2248750 RepID=A0A366LW48_9ACTN|nr:toll/interleukin-1 receptor domain-containing protein [Spongiactinospora rosea]RBQ18141.1 toll/interleukin-1 receptor domain-containing protein [Spongiactinospora rosea]